MQPAKAGPINFNRLQIDSSDPRYAALIAAEGDSLSSPSPSTESHTTVVSDGPSPSNQKSVDSEELRNVKRQLLQTQSALDMAARDLKQATDDGKKERERRKELEYHLLETQVKAESAKAAAKREIDRLEQKTQVVIYAITNQLLSSLHLLSKIRDAILPPSEVEKLANNTMAKPVKVSAVTACSSLAGPNFKIRQSCSVSFHNGPRIGYLPLLPKHTRKKKRVLHDSKAKHQHRKHHQQSVNLR
jgi:hypothetical protein